MVREAIPNKRSFILNNVHERGGSTLIAIFLIEMTIMETNSKEYICFFKQYLNSEAASQIFLPFP